MDQTIAERRKLKKVLVLLLTFNPGNYFSTKEFRLLCKFFDIEALLDQTSGGLIGKGFFKNTDEYTEHLLVELLYFFYTERSNEFSEFVVKLIMNFASYNNVPFDDDDELDRSIRQKLFQYGFTHDEVFGKNETVLLTQKQIENSTLTSLASEFPKNPLSNNIFIVHGHDEELKEKVARFVTNAGLNPIILHEQPNKGRSILQKLRDHSEDAGYAIVLFTPDDMACTKKEYDKNEIDLRSRPRQNVVFELGYFLGLLEDKLVCVIFNEIEEMPSDYKGITYIKYDKGNGWKTELLKELDGIGFELDYKNALK
jgi:predicted nucleotide-binding protein